MLNIAYFTPLPPQKTGVATFNALLLPYLAPFADLTLFTKQPDEVEEALRQKFTIRNINSFTGPLAEGFDICLYQMGNNVNYHGQIYETLRRFPGIVVLHDINLHSFYGEYLIKEGQFAAYSREMAFANGQPGLAHVRKNQFEGSRYDVTRFYLFERIAQLSLGLIVHNQYSKKVINRHCPRQTVAHIPLPMPTIRPVPTQAEAKAQLGYRPDDILLASFGFVSPSKRIHTVLQALASLRSRFALSQVRYALVGQQVEGYNLQSLLRQSGLEDIVRMVGYVNETEFQTYLAATDIGINLRYPTLGETSGTLLALMAAAKPALVSNVDAFAELPDEICLKIGVGADEQAQIEAALTRLMDNSAERRALGQSAFAYASQTCDPKAVAQKQIAFAQQILNDSKGYPNENEWETI